LNRETHGHHPAEERRRSQNEYQQANAQQPFDSLTQSHVRTTFNLARATRRFQSPAMLKSFNTENTEGTEEVLTRFIEQNIS